MTNWKITRLGHASKGKGNTTINHELQSSLKPKTHNRFNAIFRNFALTAAYKIAIGCFLSYVSMLWQSLNPFLVYIPVIA